MTTNADLNISNALINSFDGGEARDNFFSEDVDAVLALAEDVKDNDNGGSSYETHLLSRGTVGGNPRYDLVGTAMPTWTKVVFPAVDLEWKATWTRDDWLAAKTQGMAGQFDLAKKLISTHMRFTKHTLGKMLGGRGWGTLAAIKAVVTGASGTITLGIPGSPSTAAPSLANRFFVGQILGAAAVESTGDVKNTTSVQDFATITDIVTTATSCVLTCGTVPTTFAVNDLLHEKGFREYAASSGKVCVNGLDCHFDPVAAISGDSYGGITRFGRPDLQPIRFDCSSVATSTIRRQLSNMDAAAYRAGLPSQDALIICSVDEHQQLCDDAEAKEVIPFEITKSRSDGSTVTFSYSAFQLRGMRGIIPVLPSAFQVPGRCVWGPFKSKEMGIKLKYSGDAIININKGTDGLAYRLAQDGVVHPVTGRNVAGFKSEGYFRGQVTTGHPGNYMVGLNLADTSGPR